MRDLYEGHYTQTCLEIKRYDAAEPIEKKEWIRIGDVSQLCGEVFLSSFLTHLLE